MKKQYTRKQIQEAISYWKGKLHRMNEEQHIMNETPFDIQVAGILASPVSERSFRSFEAGFKDKSFIDLAINRVGIAIDLLDDWSEDNEDFLELFNKDEMHQLRYILDDIYNSFMEIKTKFSNKLKSLNER